MVMYQRSKNGPHVDTRRSSEPIPAEITSTLFNSIPTAVKWNSSKPSRNHAPEVHERPARWHTLLVRTVRGYNKPLTLCVSSSWPRSEITHNQTLVRASMYQRNTKWHAWRLTSHDGHKSSFRYALTCLIIPRPRLGDVYLPVFTPAINWLKRKFLHKK